MKRVFVLFAFVICFIGSSIQAQTFADQVSVEYNDCDGTAKVTFLIQTYGGISCLEYDRLWWIRFYQVLPNGAESYLGIVQRTANANLGACSSNLFSKGCQSYYRCGMSNLVVFDPPEGNSWATAYFNNLSNDMFGGLTKIRVEGFWDYVPGGGENFDQIKTGPTQKKIDAPSNISAETDKSCSGVLVKWSNPSNIQNTCGSSSNWWVDIYRDGAYLGNALKAGQFNDLTAVKGVDHNYKVYALYRPSGGSRLSNSAFTNEVTGRRIGPLDAPSNLKASDNICDNTEINVTWDWLMANPGNGFVIDRASDALFTNGLISFNIAADQRSYLDASVSNKTTYHYRIRAINECTDPSPSSSADTGISPDKAPRPDMPSAVVNNITNEITITWNDNAVDEDEFIIVRGVVGEGDTEIIVPTVSKPGMGPRTYVDTQVKACKSYSYRIKSKNDCGESAESPGIITRLEPNISASFTNGSFDASKGYYTDRVQLEWTVGNNAANIIDNYKVARRILGSTDNYIPFPEITGGGIFNDFLSDAGILYEYRIAGFASCEDDVISTDTVYTIGFRNKSGQVSGNVAYVGDNAVEGVKVVGESTTTGVGSSIDIAGGSITIPNNANQNLTNELLIESWIMPEAYSTSFNIISKTSDYKLHYDHSSTSYKFDVFNAGSTLSLSVHRDSIPIGDWKYIGGQIKSDKMELLIDGKVVDSRSVAGVSFTNNVSEGLSLYDGMMGKVTQLRIWKSFKDSTDLSKDYSRYMNGNESDLLVFYPMNEKAGNYVYDRSRISTSNYNKNHGLINAVGGWSTDIPTRDQLSFASYTDDQGDYILTLPYINAGENYRLTPIFETHEFDPKNKLLFIGDGSTVLNGVDFLDKSSFEMTGTVFYEGTTCPVKDAFFEVDGRAVINQVGGLVKTDVDGDFNIQVPIGKHYVEVKKSNHTFSDGRWPVEENDLFDFQEPLSRVPFKDNTQIILVGRAVGGTVEEQKIPGLDRSKNNIGVTKITLRNTKDCGWITDSLNNVYRRDTTFTTDPASGEYQLSLFPFQYTASKIELVKDPAAIDFGTFAPIDLREEVELGIVQSKTTEVDTSYISNTSTISSIDSITYNKEANFIYRSDPDFDIKTKNGEKFIGEEQVVFEHSKYPLDTLDLKMNPMLFPVFIQNNNYEGIISVFEPYTNIDNDSTFRVPVTKGNLEIDNRLAVDPSLVVDLEANDTLLGMIPYSFVAGNPNLLSNLVDIPYSFTKTFQIRLDDGVRDPKPSWEPFEYAKALAANPSNGEKYFRGYIFGDKAIDGTNFVTQGPSLVRYILRDPPGGESFASLAEQTAVSTTHAWNVSLNAVGQINVVTKGGVSALSGIGFISQSEVAVDNVVELTFGAKIGSSGAYTRTATSSNTYTTSSNANNVGAGSDIFMGQSSNYNFGLTQQLSLFSDVACTTNATIECYGNTTDGFQIGRSKRMYVAPGNIETTFFLTQKDIENYEIPNLERLRNDLLSNSTDYNSKLLPDNPNYGKNNDNTDFGTSATDGSTIVDNPPSYIFENQDSIDKIRVFNEQIELWKDALSLNEQDKIESEFAQNFSFDGGGSSLERSFTTESSDTHTWDFEAHLTQKNKTEFGVKMNGNGFGLENSIAFSETIGYGGSKATVETKTVGYTLTDPDIWDRLSIDVSDSRRGFGPVFKINAGETSCPHEGEVNTKYYQPNGVPLMIAPGTIQLEQPSLAVDVNKIVNVPDDEAAEFVFRMGNNSTQGWGYGLSLLNHTNPGGAIIVNSGTSELGTAPFVLAAGDETQQRILIERGGAYEHDSLLFVFHSTCQYDIGNDFDADIADSIYISAHFIPTCTDINIFRPDDRWVLNKSFDNKMEIVISDYNVNTANFDNFELQYKPSNEAQWNLLHKYYKDTTGVIGTGFSQISSSITSTKYIWDVLPLSDGDYDLRVTADCQIAESESDIHSGFMDRKTIEVFGTPSPADGILDPNDDILLTMNETIDEGGITSLNMDVRGVLNGTALRHETSLAFDGMDDYASIPEYQLQKRSMTIEFWLKRNALGEQMIFSQGNSSSDQLAISFGGDNKLKFQLGQRVITSDQAIIDDEWRHYAIVYDREKLNATIIIDYVLDKVENSFGTDYNSTSTILIGKHLAGGVPSLNGFMHELRIWSIPRTVAEIAANGLFTMSGRETGLIGNWPMQEAWGKIAFDKVRSRHAQLNGTTWSILPQNHSFQFDGSTDYLEALGAGQLSVDVDADITIEAWFKTASATKQTILSNGKADGTRPQDFAWSLSVNASGAVVLENDGNKLLTPAGYNDNNWHHYSAVVERTRSISIYVDGQLVSTGNASNFKGFLGPNLWIGARGWFDGPEMRDQYFKGNLDEIRIWNIARKAEQIQRDFVHQLNGDEIGLLAYYPFDGVKLELNQLRRDPNLIDASSNSYNLTLGGGTVEDYRIDAPPVKLPRLVQSVNFTYSINDDQVYIEITDPPARVENVTLDITVRGLKDLAGNFMSSPETWIAYIDKNQVFWEDEYFQFEKKLEDNLSFKAKIKNTGGSQERYTVSNLPSWLSASPSSGLIEPNSTIEVTFTVQPLLNIGEYEQDVFVSTESFGFNERLLLDLKVFVDPPTWEVTPLAFQHSMNIVGQFKINDVISTDPEDMVSVWVNDEIRGVSHVEYDPSSGKHLVFLTVLSNVTGGELLEFRAWDASRGRLLKGLMPDDIQIIGGGIIGSRGTPISIEATVLTQLQYVLNPGWNWISFPLAAGVLSDANQALRELTPTENDQLVYPGKNHVFSGGTWQGNDILTTDRGYKIKVAKADTFRYEGSFIDPSTEPIDIVAGWNWIGVKSEFIIDVPSAMASLDPQTGDVIKGQRSFAIYEDGFGWGGNLDFLQPQIGYMLKYHTSDQLIYPGNLNARTRPETQLKSRSQRGKEYAQLEKSLNYLSGKYSNTMSLIAEIDACIALNIGDAELDLSQWSLVAFAGDECRGVVESTWQSSTGKYVYYLSIEGSGTVDLQFQLVHNTNGGKISLSQTIQYASNGVVGMNSAPYQFTCVVDDCIESNLFQSGDVDMSQTVMDQRVMTDLRSDAILPSDRIYRFRAGNSIELILGFEVTEGATLEAYIEDCITTKQ